MFAEYGVISYWSYFIGAIFIIPGAGTEYLLRVEDQHRRWVEKGYVAASGVFIGDAVLMFLAYAGVATLIKTTPVLFNIIRYLGAFYLLYLGIKMLYSTFVRKVREAGAHDVHKGDIFKRSLVLSLTNPKAILFYVSFLCNLSTLLIPAELLSSFLPVRWKSSASAISSFLIVSRFLCHAMGEDTAKLTRTGEFPDRPDFCGFRGAPRPRCNPDQIQKRFPAGKPLSLLLALQAAVPLQHAFFIKHKQHILPEAVLAKNAIGMGFIGDPTAGHIADIRL